MLLFLATAAASTMSGIGIPAAGGAFSHPTEEGVLGLAYSPAAARPDRAEVMLDVGVLQNRYAFTLDGEETVVSQGISPVPFLAGAVPLGPVGLGLVAYVPYGRGGAPYDADGPQRYHTISGAVRGAELDLSASAHLRTFEAEGGPPLVVVDIGAGPRVMAFSQSGTKAFDTGALLYGMLGPDAGVELQDPFLEGTQSTSDGRDIALGWAVGGRVEIGATPTEEGRVTLTLDYRSAIATALDADMRLQPSNDLTMVIEGDVTTHITTPASADLGARIRAGRSTVLLQLGWIGWSSFETITTDVHDLTITSPDPLMESVIEGYGLTEAEFLASLSSVTTTLGMQDTLSAGVAWDADIGDQFGGRVGLGYSQGAVPDENVHPGNCDFDTWDLALGGRWEASERLWLAFGGDLYLAGDRVITNSALALTNDPSTGMVYPSGNGRYALTAARIGLTVRVRP